jgi:hypothetical protein
MTRLQKVVEKDGASLPAVPKRNATYSYVTGT